MEELKIAKDHTSFEFNDQITLGNSRQVAALGRKALSFQKRQTFTNCCCITLCPLIMVAIAGILGSFITTLIQSTSVVR
jgi:hypothetical protein